MRTRIVLWIFTLLGITMSYAQNVPIRNLSYDYEMIRLDSAYDQNLNPSLVRYLQRQKAHLDKEMNVVIGYADEPMLSYPPASSLSNFLTDIILEHANDYLPEQPTTKCDVSFLNFGGIRSSLPQGDITVGDIFSISPFENYLVFVDLKGAELRKIFLRLKGNKSNAPYAGAQVVFVDDKAVSITVDGNPLEDDRIYRMVTLNFISEGGDHIMSDILFEKVTYTPVVFRDFLIDQIRQMSKEGRHIVSKMDQRAVCQ